MDREATLIELAQAERTYEGADLSTNALDAASMPSPPAYDLVALDAEPKVSGLVSSAREEIRSMRSSLPRTGELDQEAFGAKIVRHSKRISSMLEDDKKRLSQRWSLTLEGDPDHNIQDRPSNPVDVYCRTANSNEVAGSAPSLVQSNDSIPTVRSGRDDEGKGVISFDPRMCSQYKSFLSWIIEIDTSSRQKALRALKHDIKPLYWYSATTSGQFN